MIKYDWNKDIVAAGRDADFFRFCDNGKIRFRNEEISLRLLYGYDDPKASEEKKEQYRKVQEAAKAFEEKNGSIVCRQLLGLDVNHDEYTPSERTTEYYQKRPCKELVGDAADILEELLAKYPDFS